MAPVIVNEFSVKNDILIIENKKLYLSSNEINFIENVVSKDLYKCIFELLINTFFIKMPKKIIFK